jgi:hypothetical protein
MNEAEFLTILAEAAAQRRANQGGNPGKDQSEHVTFERARELVLDPSRWAEEERQHVRNCRPCERLLARFQQHLPHPLWHSLAARVLRRLDGTEADAMGYHLDEGQCQRCLTRALRLEATRDRIIYVDQPLPGAGSPPPHGGLGKRFHLHAASPDEGMEVELIQGGDRLLLEVSARDTADEYRLVGYAFRGAAPSRAVTGFLVLRPDLNLRPAAHTSFSLTDFLTPVGEGGRDLLVCPLEPAVLARDDWEDLRVSVERDRAEPEARAAWQVWSEGVARPGGVLPEGVGEVLREVQNWLHR